MRIRQPERSALCSRWMMAMPILVVVSCIPLNNNDVYLMDAWLTGDHPDSATAAQVHQLGTSFWKGSAAREYLGEALQGPGEAGEQNLRSRFRDSYRRIPQPLTPWDEYLAFYVANFLATYQLRAASALAAIGGDEAITYLEEAIAAVDSSGEPALRADVRAALLSELSSSRWDEFQGSVSPTPAGVLDTVVLDPSALTFDGDERVLLLGGPFPGDVVVDLGTSVSFVVAAPIGRYRPALTGARSDSDTMFFELGVTSISYRGHTPDTAVQVVGHPTPERIYSVLSGSFDVRSGGIARDSVDDRELGNPIDHFNVQSPLDFALTDTVRVIAEWRGRSTIETTWTSCDGSYGDGARIQGYVFGPNSRPLAAATLTVYAGGSSFVVNPDSQGWFRLDPPEPVVPPDSVTVSSAGYPTRTIRNVHLSNRDHFFWLGGFPSNPTPGTPSDSAIRADTARTEIPPGACRMLKLLKLDDADGYVIVRLSFSSRWLF